MLRTPRREASGWWLEAAGRPPLALVGAILLVSGRAERRGECSPGRVAVGPFSLVERLRMVWFLSPLDAAWLFVLSEWVSEICRRRAPGVGGSRMRVGVTG